MRVTSIAPAILSGGAWNGIPGWRVHTADAEDDQIHAGDVLEAEDVVEACSTFPDWPVDIVGGDPLAYGALSGVCTALILQGHPVRVCTAGAISLARLPEGVLRRVVWKRPTSSATTSALPTELVLSELIESDELAFVVEDRVAFEYSLQRIRGHRLTKHVAVEMIPAGTLARPQLGNWILETGLPIRLGSE